MEILQLVKSHLHLPGNSTNDFCLPSSQNDLDDPERGMIFVCSATHKTKSMFFFLAQTEQGDIFKITLETDEDMVSIMWRTAKAFIKKNP